MPSPYPLLSSFPTPPLTHTHLRQHEHAWEEQQAWRKRRVCSLASRLSVSILDGYGVSSHHLSQLNNGVSHLICKYQGRGKQAFCINTSTDWRLAHCDMYATHFKQAAAMVMSQGMTNENEKALPCAAFTLHALTRLAWLSLSLWKEKNPPSLSPPSYSPTVSNGSGMGSSESELGFLKMAWPKLWVGWWVEHFWEGEEVEGEGEATTYTYSSSSPTYSTLPPNCMSISI